MMEVNQFWSLVMVEMLTTLPTPSNEGSRLVLYDIRWDTYEKLLELFAESSQLKMTYYKGILELMSPLPEHEIRSWNLGRLVVVLTEELGLEIVGLKSSTWRSQPKAVGAEADECFYIQNEAKIRTKLKIDLAVDPPPDLVIEIDITSNSIDKLMVYAELRVPEFWRYRNEKLMIYVLTESGYQKSEHSLAFGDFPVKELPHFMQLDAEKGENARMREFREWVRMQIGQ